MTRPTTLITVCFVAVAVVATTAGAAGTSLPQAVAQLLTDVEGLGQEISLLRAETQSLRVEGAAQIASLEADVEAERRRLDELKAAAKERAVRSGPVDDAQLRAAVAQGLDEAKRLVGEGIPYRTEERLRELTDLEAALAAGSPPGEVATRLFSFLDDTRRLASKSGRDTVDITDDQGKRRLVTALRLGTVAMFTEAQDGTVGRTEPGPDGGFRIVALGDEDAASVKTALESMKNGKQAGVFALPLGPLPTLDAARDEVTP